MSMWGPLEDWDERTSPVPVDWDGDGRLDFVTNSMSGRVYWLRNAGVTAGDKAPRFDAPRSREWDQAARSCRCRARGLASRTGMATACRTSSRPDARGVLTLYWGARKTPGVEVSLTKRQALRGPAEDAIVARHRCRRSRVGPRAARGRGLGRRRTPRPACLAPQRQRAAPLLGDVVSERRDERRARARRPRAAAQRQFRHTRRTPRRGLESRRRARSVNRRSGRTGLVVGRPPAGSSRWRVSGEVRDQPGDRGRRCRHWRRRGWMRGRLAPAEADACMLSEPTDWIGEQLTTQ